MTTTTSASTGGLSLTDFTAYELPTSKWLGWIRPRMRLRLRVQKRDFVSSTVKVGGTTTSVCWPWREEERLLRPFLADDDAFQIEVERRFLFWYKCIRRTKPVSIDQVRTGDHCALPLYDERQFTDMIEDRIEIGEITFTLRSEDAFGDETCSSTYS